MKITILPGHTYFRKFEAFNPGAELDVDEAEAKRLTEGNEPTARLSNPGAKPETKEPETKEAEDEAPPEKVETKRKKAGNE